MITLLSTRFIASAATLLSLTFVVGRVVDQNYYSLDFMNKSSGVAYAKRLDDSYRVIASENDGVEKFQSIYFPVNDITLWRISGEWKVFRIVDESKNVTELKDESVTMELRGNGRVALSKVKFGTQRVKEEMGILFISNFDQFTTRQTMVLFMQTENGYKTLEAEKVMKRVRIVNSLQASANLITENASQEVINKSGLVVEKEISLKLGLVENPTKAQKVAGFDVGGSLSLVDGRIDSLSVNVTLGEDEYEISAESTEIMDGGVVSLMVNGEEQAAILINNGQDGYALRIGQIVLEFYTDEGYEKALANGDFNVVLPAQRELAPEFSAQIDANSNVNEAIEQRAKEQGAESSALPFELTEQT